MSTPIKFGTEFLVNNNTVNSQYSPTTTALTDGRFVIIWNDESGDAWGDGVRAQIYNADGSEAGAEFVVNTVTDRSQASASATALANGGFVVTWTDTSETDGEFYGSSIRAQVFGPDGTKSGGELVVNSDPALYHLYPAIAALSDDRFVVIWTWTGFTGPDTVGRALHAQIFNADGTKSGAEVEISNPTDPFHNFDAISPLSDGRFLMTWTELDSGIGTLIGNDVRAQVFNADASKSGAEFLVNTSNAQYASTSTITVLSDARFVVVWEGSPQFGSSEFTMSAQVFNADGTRAGEEVLLKTITTGSYFAHDVAALPDGRFVMTWQGNAGSDIVAQAFNPDGTEAGAEAFVNTTTYRDQFAPKIDVLADGRFVVSWTDESGEGGDDDNLAIRAQILDPRDAAITLGGTALADQFVGTAWADRLSGAAGNDTLIGAAGNDGIKGEDGNDSLLGGAGNDTIYGGNGNDRIKGEAGDDRLVGAAGNDKITGGIGRDVMTGGLGADDFIFASAADTSTGSSRDIITDFRSGFDDIDLRALKTEGSFIGAAAFSGTAGEVRYTQTTGIISGDLNGDSVSDWSINITNKANLVAADFLF